MEIRKKIYNMAVAIWGLSTFYLVYKYSLHEGYWEHPLYVSFLFYLVILISNGGFNKLSLYILLFYIGFFIWFFIDILRAIGGS
ncbi:MAG TPA: hypothetical protein VK947_01230, partial [Planococcus sp. (in: firmicutes)]|nr:hypothetical protein [Planococcus sp. (in: firmicutes)]